MNEYQLAAATVALLLSTYAMLGLLNGMIDIWLSRINAAIKDNYFKWSYSHYKNGLFLFLFIVCLLVFIRCLFTPIQWYGM